MSKKEDKEKEKTHPKKAEDNNFECNVSDIDLLFNTSFIFYTISLYVTLFSTRFAFQLSTVRTSHIFFR